MALSSKAIAALKTNNVSKLRSLKESGRSLGLRDEFGDNLLHLAVKHKTFEAFEYLLTLDEVYKSDLNKAGYSPLMYALQDSNDNSMYAIKLIESDCEITVLFPGGDATIHRAVRKDWPEVIEVLIEKGINIEAKNKYSEETPLHVAARLSHIDIIWMLLFYGADPNITSRANLTLFDLIYTDEALLDQFSNYDKKFNLMTFLRVMTDESDTFYKLINIACDLNYGYHELRSFSRVLEVNPKMFKIFVRKFWYTTIFEEIFRTRTLVEDLSFFCPPTLLQNFCENFLILIVMESDIITNNVHAFNKSHFFRHLIKNFKGEIELLTQILCCLLSYGVTITCAVMDELHWLLGYCDLFKIMLHMKITGITQRKRRPLDEHAWPGIIYDVDKNVDDVVRFIWCDEDGNDLSVLFTVPEMDSRVPTLLELARNASRSYIIDRYQTKNSMQFYTILKWLPIAEEHKKIISFERELYPPIEKDSF